MRKKAQWMRDADNLSVGVLEGSVASDAAAQDDEADEDPRDPKKEGINGERNSVPTTDTSRGNLAHGDACSSNGSNQVHGSDSEIDGTECVQGSRKPASNSSSPSGTSGEALELGVRPQVIHVMSEIADRLTHLRTLLQSPRAEPLFARKPAPVLSQTTKEDGEDSKGVLKKPPLSPWMSQFLHNRSLETNFNEVFPALFLDPGLGEEPAPKDGPEVEDEAVAAECVGSGREALSAIAEDHVLRLSSQLDDLLEKLSVLETNMSSLSVPHGAAPEVPCGVRMALFSQDKGAAEEDEGSGTAQIMGDILAQMHEISSKLSMLEERALSPSSSSSGDPIPPVFTSASVSSSSCNSSSSSSSSSSLSSSESSSSGAPEIPSSVGPSEAFLTLPGRSQEPWEGFRQLVRAENHLLGEQLAAQVQCLLAQATGLRRRGQSEHAELEAHSEEPRPVGTRTSAATPTPGLALFCFFVFVGVWVGLGGVWVLWLSTRELGGPLEFPA